MSKADPKSRWTSMFPPSRGLEELSRRRLKPEADSWSFPVKITPRWNFLIYNYCNGSEFMVTHPQIKALTLRPDVVNPVNLRDVFHATHLLKASESHWGYFCCWFSTLHFMAFESPNIHLLGSTKNVCDHKPDGQSYPHSLVSSHTHTHMHTKPSVHTRTYIYISSHKLSNDMVPASIRSLARHGPPAGHIYIIQSLPAYGLQLNPPYDVGGMTPELLINNQWSMILSLSPQMLEG